MVLMLFSIQITYGQYTFSKGKIISLSVIGLSSVIDGAVERFDHGNRKYFQDRYNVDPYGFWGQESWRKLYINNDPKFGVKSKFYKTIGVYDFYHVSDKIRKTGYITGGIIIGISGHKVNKKPIHYVFDFLLTMGVSMVGRRIGYNYMR